MNYHLLREGRDTLPPDLCRGVFFRHQRTHSGKRRQVCAIGHLHDMIVARGFCLKPTQAGGCENTALCVAMVTGLSTFQVTSIMQVNNYSSDSDRQANVASALDRILREHVHLSTQWWAAANVPETVLN